MDNWSGQVIYAVLAISIGGALCAMDKTVASPGTPLVAMTHKLTLDEIQNGEPAQAAPRIIMTPLGRHLANSYAAY